MTLTDSTPSTGGFHCVPAFHHHFRDWAALHEPKKYVRMRGRGEEGKGKEG